MKYNIIVYKHGHTHKRVPTRIGFYYCEGIIYYIIINMYVRVRACIYLL